MTVRTVTKIVSADPGLNTTGHGTLFDFAGARRTLESTGIISTPKGWSYERKMDAQVVAFRALLEKKQPHVFGIETYGYQGPRSHSAAAFWMSRLVGRFEEAAEKSGCWVVRVTKQEANAALGLRGKVSADRVRQMVDAMFPMREVPSVSDDMAYTIAAKRRPRTDHEYDAVLVLVGAAQRWRMHARARAQ